MHQACLPSFGRNQKLVSSLCLHSCSLEDARALGHWQALLLLATSLTARGRRNFPALATFLACTINPHLTSSPVVGLQAMVYFEDAHSAGHWRAPHTIASWHASGRAGPVNCSEAARYVRIFLSERAGWSDQLRAALEDLDAGRDSSLVPLGVKTTILHCPRGLTVAH